MNAAARGDPARLVSLDQFRGYTVLGMFVVNFAGSYAAVTSLLPNLKHYYTHFTYADSIMPQFFLAVGFAYRMTMVRRLQMVGRVAGYRRVARRCAGLLIVSLVIYVLPSLYERRAEVAASGWGPVTRGLFERQFFQTLTHIALASLWVAPVIAAGPAWRIGWAIGSAALFHAISQWGGYYEWAMARPVIEGGPLGFLTWTIPIVAGTLAYDVVGRYVRSISDARAEAPERPAEAGAAVLGPPIGKLVATGVVLMAVGYGVSCLNRLDQPGGPTAGGASGFLVEPPFVPPSQPVDIWTMSQRAGSVSYHLFGAGLALVVYALFVAACDAGRLRIGFLRTLGVNALAGYVLHDLVNRAIQPFVPRDSPIGRVLLGLAVSITVCYLILRFMEKRRWFVRL